MQQKILSNERQTIPDLLKVAAIFSVVFIHGFNLVPFSASTIDFSQQQVNLFANIFRFCVPIFIFLWAYFLEKSILKAGTGVILKRFYKLLIPFIFWSLIYTIIKADIKQMSLPYIFVKYWTGYGWSGQYYFVILFQFIALFPLWRWISRKLLPYHRLVYVLSILFFIIIAYSGFSEIRILTRISDRIFIYWWPYVILGIIHARKNIFPIKVPVGLSMASLCLIPLEIYYLHPLTISPYALPSVFIASLLLLGLLQHSLKYTSVPSFIAKPVNVLANFTLGIYCLNPLVILIINHYCNIETIQFTGASVVLPLLSTLTVFSIAVLIILILRKLRLGALVST